MPALNTFSESEFSTAATAAYHAIVARHVRRVFGIPGTRLGKISWPRKPFEYHGFMWHYWWQAHLIDVTIDVALRQEKAGDLAGLKNTKLLIHRLIKSHKLRNGFTVVNKYYDDMAWLALALQRAQTLLNFDTSSSQRILAEQFDQAWTPVYGGGIRWRKEDYYFNTVSNAPVGIFLARSGNFARAFEISSWLEFLHDRHNQLMVDGLRVTVSNQQVVKTDLVTDLYTYCQGVTLGLELELALAFPQEAKHAQRIAQLVPAIAQYLTFDGVICSGGGGDGGLFGGILARYLAQVALRFPDPSVAELAKHIVTTSARSAIQNAGKVDGHILFGADWTAPAQIPAPSKLDGAFINGATYSSEIPERDLSVQLGGWLLIEAAATVE